jgi:hypothetical protein
MIYKLQKWLYRNFSAREAGYAYRLGYIRTLGCWSPGNLYFPGTRSWLAFEYGVDAAIKVLSKRLREIQHV